MLEVCSPVISSTSHQPEKISMKSNTFINSGAGHGDNIGSIITMLIDDQGADLDQILTDNRDTRHRSDNNLQVEFFTGKCQSASQNLFEGCRNQGGGLHRSE